VNSQSTIYRYCGKDLSRNLSDEHQLPIATIASLIEHRCQSESLIGKTGQARVRTAHGEFATHTYTDQIGGGPHIAFVHGDLASGEPPLVRVIAEAGALDILDLDSAQRSFSAAAAFEMIVRTGSGVVLLLATAGSASSASEPLGNSNAVRTYGIGAQILRDLGVARMRLLSSPVRLPSLEGYGLEVVETIGRSDG
ncbi:MAG: bifunctional 3,4-dihydroxy-2-butanone-4-phosphate synthase/GTP cyclohydrolase II, partial [Betaproteobacteria bacterium]|nr:bifunctional 3,4-dihydroxy-2-butanone-4-phosphate synthase/GTP cyclohydrolase II [Betaproteobacteria bacterium]